MKRLLLLIITMGALATPAAGSPCELEVSIVDGEAGSAIAKAVVLVSEYRRGDVVVAKEVTSPGGSANFSHSLPPGQYSIWASYPGFVTSSREVVCDGKPIKVTISLQEDMRVSLVELLARPEYWDGRKVLVTGFLNLEFEGDALYLHKEDWKEQILSNAIWVHPSPSMREQYKILKRRYVMIEGIFDGKDLGHMGLFQGAIRDISSCTILR
jgi:hypothetical protein